jgi:hypothetical protein
MGRGLNFLTLRKGSVKGIRSLHTCFLLASEGLLCLLQHRETSGTLEGLVVANVAPPINHLLFPDDSLLFFKANQEGISIFVPSGP